MNTWLATRSLRAKLLLGYLSTFILSIILGNLVIFMVVRSTISENTERELTNSTNIIMNMVKSAADASIKNHLRAVAEKNSEIVWHYYGEYQQGRLSEVEAKEKAGQILLSQSIGKTGYIYCVNSRGVLQVHPKINGADLSKYDFIRQQGHVKEGYLEWLLQRYQGKKEVGGNTKSGDRGVGAKDAWPYRYLYQSSRSVACQPETSRQALEPIHGTVMLPVAMGVRSL